jgi:hypothetical protein
VGEGAAATVSAGVKDGSGAAVWVGEGCRRVGEGAAAVVSVGVKNGVGEAALVSTITLVAVGEGEAGGRGDAVGAGGRSGTDVGVARPGVGERVGTVWRRGSWAGVAHAARANEPRRIAPLIRSARIAREGCRDR